SPLLSIPMRGSAAGAGRDGPLDAPKAWTVRPGRRRAREGYGQPICPASAASPSAPSNHRPEGCYSRHGMLGPQSEESMNPTNRAILDGALVVARETGANAILLAAALPDEAA